jgi:dolichyl-phosphate-mannose-protein mannosyltransferase
MAAESIPSNPDSKVPVHAVNASRRQPWIQSFEAIYVGVCILMAFGCRVLWLNLEAVEHFDEGIYASVLWYDGTQGRPYPEREFFAPPLSGLGMRLATFLPGLQPYAPFVPSILLGTLVVPAAWWLARMWYGSAAGLFAASIATFSDFHIAYSRTALTDVGCLTWTLLALGFGSRAIQGSLTPGRCHLKPAVFAGIATGLGWWTKYTGWLPLAILWSGSLLWWLWKGRKTVKARRPLTALSVATVVAGIVFLPWIWQLQSVGGYSAISANHGSYVSGFSNDLSGIWRQHLTQHLSFQFSQDGFTGALSLGIGMIAAGLFRWRTARFTWNPKQRQALQPDVQSDDFPPLRLLLRFLFAAIALTVLATRLYSPLLMTCLALAGFAGCYLWPVLQRAHQRRVSGDLSPTSPGAKPLVPGDLAAAPFVSSDFALCCNFAWFLGLLIVTPFYHPYARLFFPLLGSIWLAASGGVSWWMESNLSVARKPFVPGASPPYQKALSYLMAGVLGGAVVTSFYEITPDGEFRLVDASALLRFPAYRDRSSIVDAASEIADVCVNHLNGKDEPLPAITNRTLHPDDIAARRSDRRVVTKLTVDERKRDRFILYVYGEPALLYHLASTGVTALPVSHLRLTGNNVPAFLVFGPNAKRSNGFWEEFIERNRDFTQVGETSYQPGMITLLDLFSTDWLREHPESLTQHFEVHRIRN